MIMPFLAVVFAVVRTAVPPIPSEPSSCLSLDGVWHFALLESESNSTAVAAGKIDVPSSWEMRGYGRPRYDEDISGEVGVYRRTFEVPRSWPADGRVYLRFDGVQFGAAVSLNGRSAGEFFSSFNMHAIDVTDLVDRSGPNLLEVRTHGNPKGAAFDTNDDWTLHGIHRSVALFTVPARHVRDWRIMTKVIGADAHVEVAVSLSDGTGTADVRLLDDGGRTVAAGKSFVVENARLWTAETPFLYTLEISVPGETLRRRVGLREVSWDAKSLRVNGRPIELRGVNHHDISPFNGRAMTPDEQWKDARLIKAANCNFIRTSHYPPSQALLDACDELGIYVMDEVPFGNGNRFLEDASYGPILEERARLTIESDANRPSVIAWSVGNENPITPISVETMKLVKRLDKTRPATFPLQPNYFMTRFSEHGLRDCGDFLNWHYPLICAAPQDIADEWFSKLDKPFVSGEFAHANGLEFGAIEAYMKLVRSCPSYIGGAVWMFQDQGILRNAADLSPDEAALCADAGGGRVYDSHGCRGTDGVVYSDRTPQADYFELRQVYSPVELGELMRCDASAVVAEWSATVESHYDFLSLRQAVSGEWRMMSERGCIANAAIDVPDVGPRGKGKIRFSAKLPDKTAGEVCWLEVRFRDLNDGHVVLEKSCPVSVDLASLAPRTGPAPVLRGDSVETPSYSFSFDRKIGGVRMCDGKGRVLFASPVRLRSDRRWLLAKDFSMEHLGANPWSPKVMDPARVSVRTFDAAALVLDMVYVPTNETAVAADERMSASVRFDFLPDRVRLSYELVQNCDRKVFETGIALTLPAEFAEFSWVGQGPYESYPGTTELDNFGVWKLRRDSLYFQGNRREVRALRIASEKASLSVLPENGADFAFERFGRETMLGVNAVVSSMGCRFALPYDLRVVRKGETRSGSIYLVPSPLHWRRK